MTNVLLVIHVLAAIGIVVLVLLQQGRGADMGAAFGGGSQTLFGARGSANFLSRITAVLAAVFFLTSLSLAFLYGQANVQRSVTDQVIEEPAAPAAPAPSDIPAVPGEPAPRGAADDVPAVPGEDGGAAQDASGEPAPDSPTPTGQQ